MFRDFGPLFRAVLFDEPLQDLVLELGPLRLVAAELLDEEPPLLALLGVLRWHNFSHLLPVLQHEVLDVLAVLHHVGEKGILEEMSFVVLPLSEGALTLEWVLALICQFLEDLLGLFVTDDCLAVKLVFAVTETQNIITIVLPF